MCVRIKLRFSMCECECVCICNSVCFAFFFIILLCDSSHLLSTNIDFLRRQQRELLLARANTITGRHVSRNGIIDRIVVIILRLAIKSMSRITAQRQIISGST